MHFITEKCYKCSVLVEVDFENGSDDMINGRCYDCYIKEMEFEGVEINDEDLPF